MKPFSLYIHIPFCLQKCPYCDFNTYAVSSVPERNYVAALLSELDFRASEQRWQGRPVQSVYFGGGTPSLLSAFSIRKIITAICGFFPVQDDVEISLEANPGSVNSDTLKSFHETGVNRLSFGAQSFETDILRTLGRIHSAEQTQAAVADARAAGFVNVNLDLMYAVPGQSLEQFRSDLKAAIELNPEHISAYGLTIEKGTPFYTRYRKGHMQLPPEEAVLAMMEELNSFLPTCGYKRYEISNFAERERQARHNIAYWNGDDYLGLGAGAHSFCALYQDSLRHQGLRWSNFALPEKYMLEAQTHGCAQGWSDVLSREDLIFEFFFLGLRKVNGVDLGQFEEWFGVPVTAYYGSVLEVLSDQELLRRSGNALALSDRGLLLADSVIENFAAPAQTSRRGLPRLQLAARHQEAANS